MRTLLTALLFAAALHAQGTPTPPDPGSDSRPQPAVPIAVARNIPMCKDQLSLSTDDENGNFNGMNQSGTLVVLRNLGSSACRFPAIPQIELAGKDGPLPLTAKMSGFSRPGMGHGPVVLPVVVPGGAEITATLHWVQGEVFDQSTCVDVTAISVAGAGSKQTASLNAHICGEKGKPITYDQTRFATDPVYTPAPKK